MFVDVGSGRVPLGDDCCIIKQSGVKLEAAGAPDMKKKLRSSVQTERLPLSMVLLSAPPARILTLDI